MKTQYPFNYSDTIWVGCDYVRVFIISANDVPKDLTGYSYEAIAFLSTDPETILEFTVQVDAEQGVVRLSLSKDITSDLNEEQYNCLITQTDDGGLKTPWCKATFAVKKIPT